MRLLNSKPTKKQKSPYNSCLEGNKVRFILPQKITIKNGRVEIKEDC